MVLVEYKFVLLFVDTVVDNGKVGDWNDSVVGPDRPDNVVGGADNDLGLDFDVDIDEIVAAHSMTLVDDAAAATVEDTDNLISYQWYRH